jgi:protein TonB
MIETMNSSWIDPDSGNRRFAIAMGVGLLLELAALGVLLPVMAHKETPVQTPSVVKLSVIPPAPKPPPPVPVPPKPVVQPVVQPVPKPLPPPPKPAVQHHVVRHIPVPKPLPPPPKAVQPPPVPTPPQPVVPPAPSAGAVDAFSAAIKAALQAHASEVYPQAAQMAHEMGSPQLTFTYLNGAVSNIALTRSSGFPLLDSAALKDARVAQYPSPPHGFTGRTYQITVTVDFRLAAVSIDAD